MSTTQIIITALLAITTTLGVAYTLMVEKSKLGFFVVVREYLPLSVSGNSFSAKLNRAFLTYSFSIFSTLLFACIFLAVGWLPAAGITAFNGLVSLIKLPAMRRVYKLV